VQKLTNRQTTKKPTRTNGIFVFLPIHKPTQKRKKSLLLPAHPSPPTKLENYVEKNYGK
jgi:hypothetical protein